ncbi:MAG: hypothetical protein QME57_00480 [Patescibacteria group bacterium]|nr:hypothetical protein [Patescibacteria group bacterium]
MIKKFLRNVLLITIAIIVIGFASYGVYQVRVSTSKIPSEQSEIFAPSAPLESQVLEHKIKEEIKEEIKEDIGIDIIKTDIVAQNNHDWPTFLSIRTAKPGPPENRMDYEVLREKYPENDFIQNIITARLVGIKALPPSLVAGLTRMDKYLELYGEVKTYYVGIEYQLKKENRAFYNGVNYRLYVLGPEEESWVIVEAFEMPVHLMIEAGYGFGTEEEKIALRIQQERQRTGKFINARGEIIEE